MQRDLEGREEGRRLRALSEAIEGEIIPRLLLAHTGSELLAGGAEGRAIEGLHLTDDDVAEFAELALSAGPQVCVERAEVLMRRGVPLDALFLRLFSPTARRLGVLWTEDLRSFIDVTIALGTLQQVLRHFAPALRGGRDGPSGRQALLFPAPGEQHTFGLFMVEAFLHRAGWRVDTLPVFDLGEVRSFLSVNRIQLVGISASCERYIDVMKGAVDMVREVSASPAVSVLAGGKPFNDLPELCAEVGADRSAKDAHDVVALADELVPLSIGDERRRQVN